MTRRRIYAALVALSLLPALGGASGTTLEQRIQSERAKAQQIHARLHVKRAELNTATLHYQDLQRQLDETEAAIGRINAHIGSLQGQTEWTQRKIAWNTVQLDAARRSLRLHDAALKRRLVDIYEYGDLSYVDALIAARSFSEFVERWEDLRLLIAANQRAVRARKVAEARVAAVEADLERTRMQLQQEEQAQEEARSQLDSLDNERRNLVQLAAIRRRSVADEVAEIENLSAAEEAQLEALIVQREREIAAARRAAGIVGDSGASGHLLLAGYRDDHLALRLALQPLRRLTRVPSGPRHRRPQRHDGHRCRRRDGHHGPMVRRVRQLYFDRSRRRLLDRLRPPLGHVRLQRAERYARPGDRRGWFDRAVDRPPPPLRGTNCGETR